MAQYIVYFYISTILSYYICKRGVLMEKNILEKKVDNLLAELKTFMNSQSLSEYDMFLLNTEIDKLLNECLYYKSKLVC
jgi:hypothetical protein